MDCDLSLPKKIALFEEAFDIAWRVLSAPGDLGRSDEASLFLAEEIAVFMRKRRTEQAPPI